MKYYHTALTIAGSDPSGGAGIQADLKTFSALECYGMSIVTALTAQNTQGVAGIKLIPASFVKLQLTTIFQDITVNAIKTGMLYNASIIKVVAAFLKQHTFPLVIDPVMTSKNGSILLKNSAMTTLKKQLFPLATLITPNIPEAELLLQRSIRHPQEMENAAKALAATGARSILIKGGHINSHQESNDCFYDSETRKIIWFKGSRCHTMNNHGTGCTLSAAITAFLARSFDLNTAILQAKNYLSAALQAGRGYQLGQGHGPVHHFYHYWEKT